MAKELSLYLNTRMSGFNGGLTIKRLIPYVFIVILLAGLVSFFLTY